VSAGLSVALHGALLAVLIYGWWTFHTASHPVQTLAIDATVVSARSVRGAPIAAPPARTLPPPTPVSPPAAPPAEEQTVPRAPPNPPDEALKREQAQAAAQRLAQERVAEERQAEQAQAEAERKAQAAAQQKAEEAAERAQAEARARAVAEEQQRLAEAKRKAEAQRELQAQQKAEAQRRAREAKALAENQEDLTQSINSDEQALSARSGALATWEQLITARITRAWIRPPTARAGLDCTLFVTQVPGGEVTNVKLGPCNGDSAVQQSVIDAAYRASPLPPPPADAPFVAQLQVEFKPTD